jgi:hypothetical protein
MAHPGDVSALAAAIDAGRIDAARIVAVIGKTEGNGRVIDFTRGYFTQSPLSLLAIACVAIRMVPMGRVGRDGSGSLPRAGWLMPSPAGSRATPCRG